MKYIIGSVIGLVFVVSKTYAQYDTTYVENYKQRFSLKPILFYNILELSQKENSKNKYIPNTTMGFGLGYLSKKFIIELYIDNPNKQSNPKYNKTKALDLQIHNFSSKFSYDIYVQKYKGLYNDNKELPIYEARCPDLSVLEISWTHQYIFNNQQFSYGAGFTQNEKQLKSAGSFLLGGGMYYVEINSDSSLIFNDKRNISSIQMGINGGYAYNWVIYQHWLLCGSCSLGANVGTKNLQSFKNIYLNPYFLPRISIGYNREKWSLGIWYVNHLLYLSSTDDSKINLNTGRFVLSYVQRFGKK